MSSPATSVQDLGLLADRLRIHSIRSTSAAGSGHPTTCMSAAEIMSVLFFRVMRYDPKNPRHGAADRFVLSKGHAAPVLYAAWAEAGYYTAEDLLNLRKIDCDLEGHPTPRLPFVDVATGSLGQGLSVGVGLALNAQFLDQTNYRTYVLLGDGEIAEGAVWEAASLASHARLTTLTAIVDCNAWGQSQQTMYGHDAQVYARRFEAFGWRASVVDGHSVEELVAALEQAPDAERPTAIIAKTLKGKGVSFAEDKAGWHGKPFKKGEEEEKAVAEISARMGSGTPKPVIQPPASAEPAPGKPGPMAPPNWKAGEAVATREAYGVALAKLGAARPDVVALDGDTKNSTFSEKFLQQYPERFFECFIAEQNLVGVSAALAARGKIPFCSTFAAFFARAFDQIRMAGVSQNNIKLAGSHVGVSIGEDGPSQMGLEDLAMFRSIPGAAVFYPSDAVSTERAVELAARHPGMAYIRTSRPKTQLLYMACDEFTIGKAKVVRQSDSDRAVIVSAGVTLHEALTAADALAKEGIHVAVVDLFTVKPLDEETIRAEAARCGGRVLTVEDHYPAGGIGEAVAAALAGTGTRLARLSVNILPRSGKPEELLALAGIDAAAIARKVNELVK